MSGIRIRPASAAIREYLIANPSSWKQATRARDFSKVYHLGGERLTRPPRGCDPAHALIDDLRRKDFFAIATLPDRTVLQPDFAAIVAGHLRQLAPLVDWLCGAMELKF